MTRENRHFPSNDRRKNHCPPLGRGRKEERVKRVFNPLLFLVLDGVCVCVCVCVCVDGFRVS